MDKRRQPYVAIDVWALFSTTTTRLYEKFGPAGPLAWIGLLAAAKRAPIHGTVSCVNERDFWDQIGLPDDDHRPAMDEFLTLLGHLKQTSRTPSGRRLDVRISHFEAWQQAPKSFREAERMRRKRAQNTANDTATNSEQSGDDTATETRRDDRYVSLPSQRESDVAEATPPQQAAAPPPNGRRHQPAPSLTEHHKTYRPEKAEQYAANVGAAFTAAELERDLHDEFDGIPDQIAAELARLHAGQPDQPITVGPPSLEDDPE
jgi:hypothetical protein